MKIFLFQFLGVCALMAVHTLGLQLANEMSLHPDYKMWYASDGEEITVKLRVKTTGKYFVCRKMNVENM